VQGHKFCLLMNLIFKLLLNLAVLVLS
jgi:hypothetical protein